MAKCKKCGREMRQLSSSRVVPKPKPGGINRQAHPILATLLGAVRAANFVEENVTKYWCDYCQSSGLRVEKNYGLKE